MLSIMRKHAGSWMIKIILFAIVIVFCFFGVNTFRDRQVTYVAKVNDKTISYDLYRKTYNDLLEQYRRAYGGSVSDEMLKILRPKEQAFNQLVNNLVTLQEAERLNLKVTDKELDEAIQTHPAFQQNGVFSQSRATRLLSMNNLSIEAFRDSFRQDLLTNKVRALVYEGVTVSDEEARQWYDWYNAEINLGYVVFAPVNYLDVTPTEEQAKAYYEGNKESYRTDPKVTVRYLFFDPKSFESQVEVTDDMIVQYYNENSDEFRKEETVAARHILFKVDADADDAVVAEKKKQADDVYEQAKQGKDFAELAKKYSEGPTKDKGGDLGTFTRGRMVKPFADKAFAMSPGEVSEPVRTQFGWHIIKVEKVNEAFVEPLETVKERIIAKIKEQESRKKALEKAESVLDTVFDGQDLSATGETFNIPAAVVGPFSRKQPPQKSIERSEAFIDNAFSLETMAISDIVDVGSGFCLMQVTKKEPAVIPEFDDVKEKAKADTIKDLQNKRAKEDAQKMAEAVKGGKTLADAAESFTVDPKETGFFKRTGSIPKIGYEPKILKAAFELTTEKPFSEEPLEGRSGWYVVRLIERKAPADEGFAKEKKAIADRLLGQKKAKRFTGLAQ